MSVLVDALTARAVQAAVETAVGLGLRGVTPVVLKDASNALVHLSPAPVVARVATTAGLLRQPTEAWLRRDLMVATYLHSVGAPVVPPSAELPPGPYVWTSPEGDHVALSLWTFVEHDREYKATVEETMTSLHGLHRALRGFPATDGLIVPYMGVVLDEIPHWLKWLEVRRLLSGYDLTALREAHWHLAQRLRPCHSPTQVLHGDAHRGNLLRTPQGLLWTDFEDTCMGPVAWDIATVLHYEAGHGNEEALLALYPDAPSWSELQPYLDARELEAVVYMQAQASRYPDRAPTAERLLSQWLRRLEQ